MMLDVPPAVRVVRFVVHVTITESPTAAPVTVCAEAVTAPFPAQAPKVMLVDKLRPTKAVPVTSGIVTEPPLGRTKGF